MEPVAGRNDVSDGMGGLKAAGGAVIVTDASGGIGSAVVERLAREGWSVVATDRTIPDPDRVPAGVQARALDVADPAAIDVLARELDREGVRVAGLVNAAGLFQDVVPFLATDPALERRIFDVNYFGAIACCRVFAAAMAAHRGGAIVNITSINETRPLPLHAYAPAKAALGAATALMAGDLGPLGIRVNAVAPGFTLTPTLQAKLDAGTRDASAMVGHAALGRLVRPDEVAAAVCFLLSDEAEAITGASLPVDAGWLATSHWMDFRALAGRGGGTGRSP